MDGLLRLKKWMTAAAVCFVASFFVLETANAIPLSTATVSWSDFTTTWAPDPSTVQSLVSSFVFDDGSLGTIVSVAYLSTGGAANGKWVYAYQVIFNSGSGNIQGALVGLSPEPDSILIGSNTYNSFRTLKPVGDSRFPQFQPNGANMLVGDYDPSMRTLGWYFSGIGVGSNSVVFGYFSTQRPTIGQANLVKGLSRVEGSLPTVLVASPEPSVLSLLSIGLLGVMRFRKRRK